MSKFIPFLIPVLTSFFAIEPLMLRAEDSTTETASETTEVASAPETTPEPPKTSLNPFTGRVVKNRVRLRLLPSLDGNIMSELNQGTLLLIVGESDDFYAVEPPSGTKAYVFRTYVLDNVIEGSHVNVRLRPDTEAPVITQLNSGDRVQGIIDPSNNKWIEIAMPKSARLYVAKDYIEKAGDENFIAQYVQRQQEVNLLLNESQRMSQAELNKPFEEIHIDGFVSKYKRVIQQYPDFPDQVARAKEALDSLQNTYNEKKLAYLEKNQNNSKDLKAKNDKLAADLKAHQSQVDQLKQQLQKVNTGTSNKTTSSKQPAADNGLTYKMSQWVPVEQAIYTAWSTENNNASSTAFYEEQKKSAVKLKGMLEAYNRPVKNKPGDYMLVNSINHVPVAFIYSTHVNLQDLIGQEVTLLAVPRANNNFAFPAYYVLGAE